MNYFWMQTFHSVVIGVRIPILHKGDFSSKNVFACHKRLFIIFRLFFFYCFWNNMKLYWEMEKLSLILWNLENTFLTHNIMINSWWKLKEQHFSYKTQRAYWVKFEIIFNWFIWNSEYINTTILFNGNSF